MKQGFFTTERSKRLGKVFSGLFAMVFCVVVFSTGAFAKVPDAHEHHFQNGTTPANASVAGFNTVNVDGVGWTVVENLPGKHIYTGTMIDGVKKATAENADGKEEMWTNDGSVSGEAGLIKVNEYALGAEYGKSRTETLMEQAPYNEGHHIYTRIKEKMVVDLMGWECIWMEARCIHISLGLTNTFHGMNTRLNKKGQLLRCGAAYYSGWRPRCADCGEVLIEANHYISPNNLAKITALDLGMDYFYLCGFCGGMEQGVWSGVHECKEVSPNKYCVEYDANGGDGKLSNSYFIYANEKEYEGEAIEQQNVSLSKVRNSLPGNKDALTKTGYRFVGWATSKALANAADAPAKVRANAEGYIPDDYRIPDDPEGNKLGSKCKEQMNFLTGEGVIVLYAVWEPFTVKLAIETKSGRYNEMSYGAQITPNGIGGYTTTLTLSYGEEYQLDAAKLSDPFGVVVHFRDTDESKLAEDSRTPVSFRCFSISPYDSNFEGVLTSKSADKRIAVYKGYSQTAGSLDIVMPNYEGSL